MASTATMESEKEPFLAGDGQHEHGLGGQKTRLRKKLLQAHGILLCIQLILVLAHVVIAIHGGVESESSWTLSPAQPAIQYEVQDIDYEHLYTGEPRSEVDQAWSLLLRSSMIRLSEEEMRKMNKTSVALRDGSGYVGYIEAIHMLHCVKRIYQAQYPEHYPRLQEDEDAFSVHHWNHCLEVLRQGIMCNADVAINTYFWETPHKIKGSRARTRKCTDWGRLQAWADERTLSASDKDAFLETLVPMGQAGSIGPFEESH